MGQVFKEIQENVIFNFFELQAVKDLVKISKIYSDFHTRDIIPIFVSTIDSNTNEYFYFNIPCETGVVNDTYFLNIYYIFSKTKPKKYFHYLIGDSETVELTFNTRKATGFYIPIIHLNSDAPIIKNIGETLKQFDRNDDIIAEFKNKIQLFKVESLYDLFKIISMEGEFKKPIYRLERKDSITFFALMKVERVYGKKVRIVIYNGSSDELNLYDWKDDIILSGWRENIVNVVSVRPLDYFL